MVASGNERRTNHTTADRGLIAATPRGRGRPFAPGQSGNPTGRPKGFGSFIRQETAEGAELVEYVLSVLRDETAARRVRLEAATWLADRGWGRPVQATELVGPGGGALLFGARQEQPEQQKLDLSRLTDEEFAQLLKIYERLGLVQP